jgi:L-glutamine-phosphate cytidylyltransferase
VARLRAAVLAAGRGVRMGGGTPKSLLPVKGNDPLLHFILRALQTAGIDDLLVVTGHRPRDVQAYVEENWNGDARFIWNPRYASWGNFHSVRIALDQSPGSSLLISNSDIVVHPDVIRRTIAQDGDLVLAVQKRKRLDIEDMRVELAGDRVRDIGKALKLPRSHGEYAGISLVRPTAARLYQELCTTREWRAETDGYYEDVYRDMIGTIDVRASSVEAGEYAEVDTPEDLQAAIGVINQHYPKERVQASEGT